MPVELPYRGEKDSENDQQRVTKSINEKLRRFCQLGETVLDETITDETCCVARFSNDCQRQHYVNLIPRPIWPEKRHEVCKLTGTKAIYYLQGCNPPSAPAKAGSEANLRTDASPQPSLG